MDSATIPMPRHALLTRRASLLAAGAAGLCAMAGGQRAFAAGRTSLVYGLSAYPPNLRPWENVGAAAGTVKLMLHRGLLGYDSAGNLSGELARSWEPDGDRAYVFALRPEARFHNGDPVTSADVRYSLEQMTAPDSTAFLRPDLQAVERVETPDAKTVRIVLKEPSAVLPFLLAGYNALIVSAKSTPENPIGAGPFTLKGMEKGSYVEVGRFDGFYKPGKPSLRAIRFAVYADETLRLAALQSGELDIIEYVPWQDMDEVAHDPKLVLTAADGPFMYVLFNTTRGPFADARVRRAVGYAVNRPDVIKAAFAGKGSELRGLPIPPGTPFAGDDPAASWTYDPGRARALLAEAGFPNGFRAMLLATAQYAMHKDTAEVVQQNLAAIGVQTQLTLPDWPARIQMGAKGRYDLAVLGSAGDYNDPASLSPFIGSGPPSYVRSYGFGSARIDDLLRRGRETLDHAARAAAYAELRKAFFEEAPIVGLNWRTQAFAHRKDVKGFHCLPGFLTAVSPYTLDDVTLG